MRTGGGRAIGVLLLIATVAVAASTLFGRSGARHLQRLHAQRVQVADATFALLRGNQALRDDIDRLRHDELYLEQLARRQLGLVRPNEHVFRFRRPAR